MKQRRLIRGVALCTALEILGIPCYHGFTLVANVRDTPQWIEALDWKYAGKSLPAPDMSDGRPSREFWDRLLGDVGTAADLPCIVFAEELLHAYPEAKVVLVERDIERWYRSFDANVITSTWSPITRILAKIDPIFSRPIIATCDRWTKGFFHAGSKVEMRARARTVYREHYAFVRAITPAERLLEFKLADGWGPLCEFLGKGFPGCPFPHVNDTAAFRAEFREISRRRCAALAYRVLPAVVALAVVIFAIKLYAAGPSSFGRTK